MSWLNAPQKLQLLRLDVVCKIWPRRIVFGVCWILVGGLCLIWDELGWYVAANVAAGVIKLAHLAWIRSQALKSIMVAYGSMSTACAAQVW